MGAQLEDRERSAAYRAPRVALSLTDFDLLEHLGDGSFSQVLHARHRASGTECALKIIDKHLILRNKQWDQVRTERNVLDRLDHHGVVHLLFTFQCPASLYFGLEFCPQGELFEQITRRGQLSVEQTCFYAAEVVDVLCYLQSQKVVHRDLKPENLLLSATGHLKLADFGSAKDLSEDAATPDGMRANILAGTADYIAPEVLRNEVVSCAADLWALGCLIFQMLVGKPPFRDRGEYLTLERVSTCSYSFPSSFPYPDAQDLVSKLLVLEPRDRLGAGEDGMQGLKRHAFFTGIKWEHVRERDAPAWLPTEPAGSVEDEGFNWELTSLLAALPLHVEPPNAADVPSRDHSKTCNADEHLTKQQQQQQLRGSLVGAVKDEVCGVPITQDSSRRQEESAGVEAPQIVKADKACAN